MSDTPEKPSSEDKPSWMLDSRPEWWPAWTEYPHGSLDEKRARQLSKHTVNLEETLAISEAEVVESQKAYNHQAHRAHVISKERDSLQRQLAEAQQSCNRHLEGVRNIAVVGLGLSDPWSESSDGSDWTGTLSQHVLHLRQERDTLEEQLANAEARLLEQGKTLADYQAADRETEHFIENLKFLHSEQLATRDAEVGRLREIANRLSSFAVHHFTCELIKGHGTNCSCGLTAAREALAPAEQEPKR